jgi:hypothetical protein
MSTRDYKTPNEIVIKVSGNRRAVVEKDPRKGKGSVPVGKKGRRFLHRRKKPGKGINFYDLGQLSNGSGGWIENDYRGTTEPFGDVPDGRLIMPAPAPSEYDGRDAQFLVIPAGDLKTKSRRVTKGTLSGKYRIVAAFGSFGGLLDDLEQWTPEGLDVEQADLTSTGLIVTGDGFLPFFSLVFIKDGQANQKITTSPNYAAAAAAFSPVPEMDVFLPPSLGYVIGNSRSIDFGDRAQYGFRYMPFPRRFVINTNDPWRGGNIGLHDGGPPGPDDPDTAPAIENWKAIIPNRGFHFDYISGTFTGPGEAFPIPGWIERAIGFAQYDPTLIGGPNGSLLAIVRKAATFYYFWSDGF